MRTVSVSPGWAESADITGVLACVLHQRVTKQHGQRALGPKSARG